MVNENGIYQIFISYRRDGSDAHARIIYDKLRNLGFRVFLDFESLFSGGFRKNVIEAIKECTDFILLIPKGGFDRCEEESDLFREEIKTALDFNKNIIPVFVNDFKMPNSKDLPDDIASITERNGIHCSMEYFDAVFEKICRNLFSIPQDEFLHKTIENLTKRVYNLEHSYFRKWACMKLNHFLSENNLFFDGTNWTNPHSEDTFGVSGILFTKSTIKAITSVSNYWEDNFTIEYLKKQGELVKKGIDIYRIFILEKDNMDIARPQLEYQRDLGIKVYYIYKDNEYIDPKWLEEDYLIQDDKLLVQIFCSSHQFSSQNQCDEQITVDVVHVKNKIERFHRILERSEKFV